MGWETIPGATTLAAASLMSYVLSPPRRGTLRRRGRLFAACVRRARARPSARGRRRRLKPSGRQDRHGRTVQSALVICGYHGTPDAHAAVIPRDGVIRSDNDYDCPGDGVYFFEDGLAQAGAWATRASERAGGRAGRRPSRGLHGSQGQRRLGTAAGAGARRGAPHQPRARSPAASADRQHSPA
jgi:hypothetical protein